MKALKASWLLSSDDNCPVIRDGAIVFSEIIQAVGTYAQLQEQYPDLTFKDLGQNSVIMPGLVNSHVHLEFSSNTTTLQYGNFMGWLNSVIANREELVEKATSGLIASKLDEMLQSGTTTIGAISSYAHDIKPCVQSPMNTVFFSEAIGSKMDMIDTLFADFKSRLKQSQGYASKNFIPAVAIHSPYSVHPFLVREVLKLSREEDLAVTAHFLESPEEFDWLHKDEGGFVDFFKNFLGQSTAVTKPMEFLNQFMDIKHLSFTHCVEASERDIEKIGQLGAYINHCPVSNRLLNNSKLKLEGLNEVPFTLGTDGLSSNNSLSLFDELRAALMVHENQSIASFAYSLLHAATINGAKALGLNKGVLTKNADADIIAFTLPDEVKEQEQLALQVILHTKEVDEIIIGGENV